MSVKLENTSNSLSYCFHSGSLSASSLIGILVRYCLHLCSMLGRSTPSFLSHHNLPLNGDIAFDLLEESVFVL